MVTSQASWTIPEPSGRMVLNKQRPLPRSRKHKVGLLELCCSSALKSPWPTGSQGPSKAWQVLPTVSARLVLLWNICHP